jgi:large subunit ribosomal protein L22
MEGKALGKHLRISPRKMRRVAELIRGKNTEEAINILHFTRKNAATHIEKALRSAVANVTFVKPGVDPHQLFIKEIFVDGGPMLKRGRAGSMGRRSMIRRRTSHVTVIVAERA